MRRRVVPARLSSGLVAVKVGRGGPSVDEKVGAGDEGAARPHEELGHAGHLVGRAGAVGRARGQHLLVEPAPWALELVESERRDDDARRDGIDAGAAASPAYGLGHDALDVAALGELVGVKRVADALGLQQGEAQERLGGSAGQLFVFFGCQGGQAMPRLAGNRDTATAGSG